MLTGAGFISVNIVFFQDDSATRGAPPSTPVTVPTVPPATAAPPAASAPLATPIPSGPPAVAPVAPAPTPRPVPEPEPARSVTASAGVALGPTAATLAAIEILRGRAVHLWPRAFVDGAAVPVRSWRLLSGGADLLSRTSGAANESCDATWLTPTPSNAPALLRFEVTSDAAPGRVLIATVLVTVRSPALLQ
ncbi:MAG TPA: hypothetical protein VFC31_13475 [Candidatus Limnocylindria bacterium]|nr:hypothetical protein [Candidatus Limnocylindria bacterium]